MAYLYFDEPVYLLKQLNKLENADEICEKALTEAIPIVEKALVEAIKANHVDTGDLWKSIVTWRAHKTKSDNWIIAATPTGRAKNKRAKGKIYKRSKHQTRTRGRALYNGDKLFYLEYGTSNQNPSPILEKVINKTWDEVADKLQEVFNREAGL